MRIVQASQVIAESKFNKFHLLVFLWCFYAIAFDGFDIAMYGIGLPLMIDDFGLTVVEAGAIGSYTLIGMMIGSFLLGSLSDLIGRKKMIAICMLLFSVFSLLAGLAPNPLLFTIMRFIAALGMGGLMPAVIAHMTEYSPKKNRALIVATMYCGYSIGAILASLTGMYLMETLGWRFLYWLGIIPLFTLPFFLKYFPESLSFYIVRNQGDQIAKVLNRIDPKGQYQATDDFEYKSVKERAKGFPAKKLFLDNRAVSTLAFWMTVFSCLLMIYGLNTWLPKIMQESGFGITSSLSFSLVLAVGQIGGSLIGGYLVDRLGHRNVLLLMFLIGAVCFVSLSLTSNLVLLYVLIAIGGACTGGTQNLVNPYISEFYPQEIRTTGLSITVGIGRIGAISAPLIIGLLLAANLAPKHTFMAFAIPSIIGGLSLMFVQEKYGSFEKRHKTYTSYPKTNTESI
ncbi:aromatic acid/H+ symport family MFS transporter [Mesobacillus maritimus]|uniref:MFS transporter n=1 Tax=Mesobacillus maritimus TaxID=1643336 RepID=UPI00203BE502|nr:aromatic acid/H+ symport family MFS transporter [Mesobacillus maritimus]MCM3588698.1 aromatic acid/H+ symport family MFS transporter [Mesobacillus maritimus]MCM3671921.1 aromatic acid/H+ symport family MFS transporter [Mesobacillus maritimus]